MNEYDKLMSQLSRLVGWIRSAKEDEDIRPEMLSAAAKTCRDVCGQIEQLAAANQK